MRAIFENLYQFSTYIPQINFSIHSYLLASRPSLLFASGTAAHAAEALRGVREILGGAPLDYIFVSHMESDECGGLPLFLREYPSVRVLCSRLCARELPGFGADCAALPQDGGARLRDGGLDLLFFSYPSEVHLQDGLLCYEMNGGIFYSSDLMQRPGDGRGRIAESAWLDEISAIGEERIPNREKLEKLRDELRSVSPRFAAVGHGTCLKFA